MLGPEINLFGINTFLLLNKAPVFLLADKIYNYQELFGIGIDHEYDAGKWLLLEWITNI